MTHPKKLLITGGTGMIGKSLLPILKNAGYKLIVFSTRVSHEKKGVEYVHWNPSKNIIDANIVGKANVIIHLAGAGIAEKRWTPKRKKILLGSRTKGIRLIANTLAKTSHSCEHFITAGGVGFYGVSNRLDTPLKETASAGDDFVAQLCVKWEQTLESIATLKIPTTVLRTGIVLDFKGGALQKMSPVFKWGMGAPLGTGKQIFPWISLHDICAMYHFVIGHKIIGVYNATAPSQITNADFSRALAGFLNRPFLMPAVPAVLLRGILGSRAQLLLTGNVMSSEKIIEKGFVFKHKKITDFLSESTL